MSGMVRGDVRKRDMQPAVTLTAAEVDALEQAAWKGGRRGWISFAEVSAIEAIIAARLAAVTQ